MRRHTIITVTTAIAISGCATPMANVVYNSVSVASVITTNKSLAEHGAGAVTSADCSMYNYVFMNRDYVCESRDVSKTYNRTGF